MEKAEKRRHTLVSVDDEVKERTKEALAVLSLFAKAGKACKTMFETKAESGRNAEAARTMYMEEWKAARELSELLWLDPEGRA